MALGQRVFHARVVFLLDVQPSGLHCLEGGSSSDSSFQQGNGGETSQGLWKTISCWHSLRLISEKLMIILGGWRRWSLAGSCKYSRRAEWPQMALSFFSLKATNLQLVKIEDALGPGSMANKKQLSWGPHLGKSIFFVFFFVFTVKEIDEVLSMKRRRRGGKTVYLLLKNHFALYYWRANQLGLMILSLSTRWQWWTCKLGLHWALSVHPRKWKTKHLLALNTWAFQGEVLFDLNYEGNFPFQEKRDDL